MNPLRDQFSMDPLRDQLGLTRMKPPQEEGIEMYAYDLTQPNADKSDLEDLAPTAAKTQVAAQEEQAPTAAKTQVEKPLGRKLEMMLLKLSGKDTTHVPKAWGRTLLAVIFSIPIVTIPIVLCVLEWHSTKESEKGPALDREQRHGVTLKRHKPESPEALKEALIEQGKKFAKVVSQKDYNNAQIHLRQSLNSLDKSLHPSIKYVREHHLKDEYREQIEQRREEFTFFDKRLNPEQRLEARSHLLAGLEASIQLTIQDLDIQASKKQGDAQNAAKKANEPLKKQLQEALHEVHDQREDILMQLGRHQLKQKQGSSAKPISKKQVKEMAQALKEAEGIKNKLSKDIRNIDTAINQINGIKWVLKNQNDSRNELNTLKEATTVLEGSVKERMNARIKEIETSLQMQNRDNPYNQIVGAIIILDKYKETLTQEKAQHLKVQKEADEFINTTTAFLVTTTAFLDPLPTQVIPQELRPLHGQLAECQKSAVEWRRGNMTTTKLSAQLEKLTSNYETQFKEYQAGQNPELDQARNKFNMEVESLLNNLSSIKWLMDSIKGRLPACKDAVDSLRNDHATRIIRGHEEHNKRAVNQRARLIYFLDDFRTDQLTLQKKIESEKPSEGQFKQAEKLDKQITETLLPKSFILIDPLSTIKLDLEKNTPEEILTIITTRTSERTLLKGARELTSTLKPPVTPPPANKQTEIPSEEAPVAPMTQEEVQKQMATILLRFGGQISKQDIETTSVASSATGPVPPKKSEEEALTEDMVNLAKNFETHPNTMTLKKLEERYSKISPLKPNPGRKEYTANMNLTTAYHNLKEAVRRAQEKPAPSHPVRQPQAEAVASQPIEVGPSQELLREAQELTNQVENFLTQVKKFLHGSSKLELLNQQGLQLNEKIKGLKDSLTLAYPQGNLPQELNTARETCNQQIKLLRNESIWNNLAFSAPKPDTV